MSYIIMDFEYNQAFNFKKHDKGQSVEECPFEIIQIGAVKIDDNFNLIEQKNILIKPLIYKRVHPYVEKITKLNNFILDDKQYFTEIYEELIRFLGTNYVLCFWGDNDIIELYKNISYFKLDYNSLPKEFINVQKMASRYMKFLPGRTIGLKNAVEAMGLPMDLVFHDALNDAVYTAEILKELKTAKMPVEKINLKFLNKQEKTSQRKVNTSLLYKAAEKELGRKLTMKEKNVVKHVYDMGKKGVFDINQKIDKSIT